MERDPAEGRSLGLTPKSLAEERAISAVWRWFVHDQNRHDVPFATIVLKVHERCPHADVGRIASEFARRHQRALQRGTWG